MDCFFSMLGIRLLGSPVVRIQGVGFRVSPKPLALNPTGCWDLGDKVQVFKAAGK